jgi:hypothetical protein
MHFYALVQHQWETAQTLGQKGLQAHVFLNQYKRLLQPRKQLTRHFPIVGSLWLKTIASTRPSLTEDNRLNPALSYASSKRGLHEKVSYVSRYERNSKLPFLSMFVRARGAQANGVTLPVHMASLSRDLPRDPVPVCGSPDHVHHATLSVGERPAYNPIYKFYYRMKRN